MKSFIFTILFAIFTVVSYSQNLDGFFDKDHCYMEVYESNDSIYQINFVPILYYQNESFMDIGTELYLVPNSPNTEDILLPSKQEYYLGEEIEIYLLTDGITIFGTLHKGRNNTYGLYLERTSNIVEILSELPKVVKINKA